MISPDYVYELFHVRRMDTAAIAKRCFKSEFNIERQLNRALDERSTRDRSPLVRARELPGGIPIAAAGQRGDAK